MALVVDLKPEEKILVGEVVITNDKQRTRLHIDGKSPIMREKDIMQEKDADTICKKIYFLIQCMYITNESAPHHGTYFALLEKMQDAAPSTSVFFLEINKNIIAGKYFKALKAAKKLIDYERKLLDHALRQPDDREHSNAK